MRAGLFRPWLLLLTALLAASVASGCSDDESTPGSGLAGASGGTGGSAGSAAAGGGGTAGAGGGVVTDCDIFAAPAGSGSECSVAAPCALSAARQRARAAVGSMDADLIVCLRDGRYALTETFELGAADSGQNGHEVVYAAYPGETPVLSGGELVAGWQPAFGSVWSADVGAGFETRQLYVDGRRAQRARGSYHPAGFAETATGYTAPDASMASWAQPSDLEVVGLAYWKAFRCSVASIAGTAITMDEPCWSHAQWHTPFDMGLPTWFENALELLDEPGEWYLDRAAGVIYYYPRPGEDLSSAEVVAPSLQTLVRLTGSAESPVTALRLHGVTFAHSTWLGPSTPEGYAALQAGYHIQATTPSLEVARTPGAVVLSYAAGVTLEENRFEHLGSTALVIEPGQDNVVVGNVFRDVSGSAVHLGEVHQPHPADPADATTGNVLRDNYITDTGVELFDTAGIFAGYVADSIIEHNELHNLPYTGISVGWGWSLTSTVAGNNLVRHNLVHHVMQRLMDGGHIYTLSTQPGTRIEDNYFHDLLDMYGGIYLDQGSEFITVERNVVASVPYWYLLQPVVPPFAQNNTVQDNYADTASVYCCQGSHCCTDTNTIANNTELSPGIPSSWPAGAVAIMADAGLSGEYAHVRPGHTRIEAEDYLRGGEGVGYHDLLPGNQGGAYRADDVDLYQAHSRSNHVVVGYTQTGEWLQYYLDLPASGDYTFEFVVGTQADTDAIALAVDGAGAGTLALPNTGSWNSFATATLADVTLTQGPHLLRLTFTGGFNLDAFTFRRQ